MANTKYYYQNYDIFRRVSDIREEFLKDVKDKDTTLYIKPIENTFGEYDEFNNEVDKILESEYTLDYKTDFFLIYKHK